MRISIIGGGPAGLYFAILMKKARAGAEITVHERNRSDDTFGFGVVFSDQTLENFQRADPESYAEIADAFAYWDDISISRGGETFRIGGNGFCGCSRRTLLLILQKRARTLGVKLKFSDDIPDPSLFADADLIIAADGANSTVRALHAGHFKPKTDLRRNKFVWMGSTKPLDAFTFIFKQTDFGIIIAHAYQYEPGRSTWIFEMSPEAYEKSGFWDCDEAQSAVRLADLFKTELDDHALITNRSLWRNFPMIRNERWVKDNLVLIGDAKATAHFSIGSGTKLAMEDAIGLFNALQAAKNVRDGLARFETQRREEVEKTQHAADVSLVWFEHIERFWGMDPAQFAFGVMTRSKAITYDNLNLRAPDFVTRIDRTFAREAAAEGFDVDVDAPRRPMFQPFRLRDMTLANRIVLSPMCMYAAVEGAPDDFHFMHYASRAAGGAGLLFTEMTCVSADARITPGCAGIYTDAHEAQWKRIVDFTHRVSAAKICLQLGHAGRKGATKLMWDGMDEPLEAGAWPVISASAVPWRPGSQTPREMSRADMDRVRADFVAAARRGARAGFDMLELHAAHGYLLAGFLSPLTNKRTDAYGGTLADRLLYPLEVFGALRAEWPAAKPMSVRISATDWAEGGIGGDEAAEIARAFRDAGCDLIDVSTGQTVSWSRPVYGRMFQLPFADQIRNEAHVATMCVGSITSADQANTILAAGRADLVALGRAHLADPSFTLRAAASYGDRGQHVPPNYAPGFEQMVRVASREREDIRELRMKAKPKPHVRKAAE